MNQIVSVIKSFKRSDIHRDSTQSLSYFEIYLLRQYKTTAVENLIVTIKKQNFIIYISINTLGIVINIDNNMMTIQEDTIIRPATVQSSNPDPKSPATDYNNW